LTASSAHELICGDNLPVMTAMLSDRAGAFGVVYLDPPYNTGATDWAYRNRFGGEWGVFMRQRLAVISQLMNPQHSALIATIDEKEYLQLGFLLKQTFPTARIQMVTTVINPRGVSRKGQFARTDEYIFYVLLGDAAITPVVLGDEWGDSAHTAQRPGAYWRAMVRRGEHETRADRPGLFYPVFVDPGTFRVVGIGDAIGPRDDPRTVDVPRGSVAVWPKTSSGGDGRWRIAPDTARGYLAKKMVGGAKAKYSGGHAYIHYLAPGEQAKIASGHYVVAGERPNGTLDIEVAGKAPSIPGTTWSVTSHDAGRYGTKLLSKLVPGERFPYAKSLYAVADQIRFVTSNKTDTLILDPFGGSGTTAHAAALLDASDGGCRSTVTITANEVSSGDQVDLLADGRAPGDPEWEARGIFRRVTVPRVSAALTGKTAHGAPISGRYGYGFDRDIADGLPGELVLQSIPNAVTSATAF